MGWFWWNWETDPNAGGPADNWYPPQNKPAQDILNQYYSLGLNTPPIADNLQISPTNPLTTDNLVGSYIYSDADGDAENGTEIRWYKNGVLQPQLNDTLTASSALTAKEEIWFFTAKPKDGKDFGTLKTSPSVTIQNSPPKIDLFTPINMTLDVDEGENLQFTQTSSDPDNDPLTYSWLLDSVQKVDTLNWTYCPGHSDIGVHNVTLVVSDGALKAITEWRVTVRASLIHDVAITEIRPAMPEQTRAWQGLDFNISVTARNKGNFTETFDIIVYANTTAIQTKQVTLENKSSLIITFTWNTSDFAKGNYTTSAVASTVSGETDTTDNTLTDGWVLVTFPGDVNGDGRVRVDDVLAVALAFGGDYPEPPYEANLDINGDLKIRVDDVLTAALNFGQG